MTIEQKEKIKIILNTYNKISDSEFHDNLYFIEHNKIFYKSMYDENDLELWNEICNVLNVYKVKFRSTWTKSKHYRNGLTLVGYLG